MARTRGPRSVEAEFRALLRVLPFDFRDEHGREIEQVFRAQREGLGATARSARSCVSGLKRCPTC